LAPDAAATLNRGRCLADNGGHLLLRPPLIAVTDAKPSGKAYRAAAPDPLRDAGQSSPTGAEIQQFWADQRIYETLAEQNPGEPFVLHDGPPYANGALHVGHALNKILKDIINKHALLQGKRARFVPGWDCHGLPIELKVLQAMGQGERRGLTPLDLRRKAHAYALQQVDNQRQGFRRWGIWADWERPYLTLNKGLRGGPDRSVRPDGGGRPHLPGAEAGALEPQLPHGPGGGRTGIPRRPHLPQRLRGLPGGGGARGPGGAPGGGGHRRALAAATTGGAAAGGDLDHHPLDPARQPGGVGERALEYAICRVRLEPPAAAGATAIWWWQPIWWTAWGPAGASARSGAAPPGRGTGGDALPPPAAGAHQSGGGGGRVHHHRIGHGPGAHGTGPWRGRLSHRQGPWACGALSGG
jgi:hypothetical protein